MSRGRIFLVTVLLGAAILSSCTSKPDPDGGAETSKKTGQVIRNAADGVWELDRGKRLTAASTIFTALVSRLGCNNGVTGEVVNPVVEITKSQIIVTFQVTPGDPEAANCPGNDLVPYEVELSEPIGRRQLMDGRCLGRRGRDDVPMRVVALETSELVEPASNRRVVSDRSRYRGATSGRWAARFGTKFR